MRIDGEVARRRGPAEAAEQLILPEDRSQIQRQALRSIIRSMADGRVVSGMYKSDFI